MRKYGCVFCRQIHNHMRLSICILLLLVVGCSGSKVDNTVSYSRTKKTPISILRRYGTTPTSDYRTVFFDNPNDSINIRELDFHKRYVCITNVLKEPSGYNTKPKSSGLNYHIEDDSRYLCGNFNLSMYSGECELTKLNSDQQPIYRVKYKTSHSMAAYLNIIGKLGVTETKFDSATWNVFQASNIEMAVINAKHCYIDCISKFTLFENCIFDSLLIVVKGSYMVRNCVFKHASIGLNLKPDSIIWDHSSSDEKLYFAASRYVYIDGQYLDVDITLRNSDTGTLLVELANVNVKKIKLNSSEEKFDFVILPSKSPAADIRAHKDLVSYFSDVEDLKMRYDVRLKKFENSIGNHYIKDWIEEHWNNYGYDKDLIFRNSLYLMLFFFLVNLLFFRTLLVSVYEVEKLDAVKNKWEAERNPFVALWFYVMHCFVFTCYIFWGLKLDLQHLKHEKLAGSLWVIFQYLVGIVCLAYIANIIITK